MRFLPIYPHRRRCLYGLVTRIAVLVGTFVWFGTSVAAAPFIFHEVHSPREVLFPQESRANSPEPRGFSESSWAKQPLGDRYESEFLPESRRHNAEIWRVNSSRLSLRPSEKELDKLVFYRLENNRWVVRDAPTFYSTHQPEEPLLILSPGYTSTSASVTEVGLQFVSQLRSPQPYRLLLWDWPAAKQYLCISKDVRSKVPVADASAYYLSHILRALPHDSHVCLLGFSMGSRIALDAVHKLSGHLNKDDIHLHLVLMAAASDQQWLKPNGRQGEAPKVAEKMLIMYNPRDPVLKLYPFLESRIRLHGPMGAALGRFGPLVSQLDQEVRAQIEAVNISGQVGKEHLTMVYVRTPDFQKRKNEYLFFHGE